MSTKLPKFSIGDRVILRSDVLTRHARSIPAHAGYTHEQFVWRDTLRKLEGKIGVIERTFPNSKHVNVGFEDGTLIGIDSTELISTNPVSVKESLISIFQGQGYDFITAAEEATKVIRDLKKKPRGRYTYILKGKDEDIEVILQRT